MSAKTIHNLFVERGKLIKQKQNLFSWLELYKTHERLDTFKPEDQRYLKSRNCKEQIQVIDLTLKQIENQINTLKQKNND